MKVLFVSYGGGHIQMTLPVMHALRKLEPDCEATILALTTAFGVARRAGEQPLGYRDFCRGGDAARAIRYGEMLLDGRSHAEVAVEESLAYLGFNFLEWVDAEGEARAWQRWREQGRHGFRPVRFMTRVLRELRPDVVVTTNSPRSEEAAIAAAASLGIPSLSMVDLFALPGDPFATRPVHATRVAVLSDATRANLVRAGMDPERIIVTGNPAFDALTQAGSLRLAREWRQARAWQDCHVVLWAGHKEPDDAVPPQWAGTGFAGAVQERLVEWVLASTDVCLSVRYHPNEWEAFDAPPVHPRIHWSRPDLETLEPVLMAADQVLVQGTTVGAQAFAAGKRVACLSFSPMVRRSGMDYAALGMADPVPDLSQVVPVLRAGIGKTGDRRSIGHHAAANCVARHVVRLVRQGACP